jgi:phage shock protein E
MNYNLKDATIVDVRSPQEFAQDHYPGAINIPIDQVPQRVQEFKEMKTPIVAYCRSGNRSGMAVSILKQAGVQDVYNGGGLEDLQQQTK